MSNRGSNIPQIPVVKSNNARIRLQNEDDHDLEMLKNYSGTSLASKFKKRTTSPENKNNQIIYGHLLEVLGIDR